MYFTTVKIVFNHIRSVSSIRCFSNSSNIIRKLGGTESFYVKSMNHDCVFMNSRCLLVESKIDLYEQVELLKKAVDHWKNAHHFLRVNIIQKNTDYYFAYAPSNLVDNIQNVKYLTYESNDNDTDYWQHIFEREFQNPIDSYNSLLWRLMFIKFKNTQNYRLIFTANHSIIDGRNAFCILSQLVSIIEKVYLNKPLKLEPYEILPPIHLYDHVQKHGKLSTDDNHDHHFVELEDAFKYDVNKANCKKTVESNGVFLNLDKTPYLNMSDILRKNNDMFTKIDYLRFDSTTITQLLKACKMNNCKLTGCLNLIAIMATQQMLLKFAKTNANPITYGFTVDNRQFLVPRVDPYHMGTCSLVFHTNFDELLDLNDETFWSTTFWKYVKRESDRIHERLNNGEHLDIARNDEFFDLSDMKPNKVVFHFVIANRGDMSKVSNMENGVLKIKEHFNAMSFGPVTTPNLFFHSLDSIDKNLAWSFTYNNRLISQEQAKFLGDFITSTIQRLV